MKKEGGSPTTTALIFCRIMVSNFKTMNLTLKMNTIMKKMHLRSMLILALVAFIFSCESEDISESPGRFDSLDVSTLTATAETGQWQVASYVDDDDDDDDSRVGTADFDGFSFQFNSDGSLLVIKEDLEITGTWRVYLDDDSDYDDDSSDDDQMEFDINLNTSIYALLEIVEDWDVVEYSDSRIHLVDYDADNSTVNEEVLIFERI
jgi:hypothetical protein